MTGADDVQRATATFDKGMEELDLKRRIDIWETPAGYSIRQTFLLYTLRHVSTYHMEKIFSMVRLNTLQSIIEHLVDVRDWSCLTSVLFPR